jgi:hypothetical protein
MRADIWHIDGMAFTKKQSSTKAKEVFLHMMVFIGVILSNKDSSKHS